MSQSLISLISAAVFAWIVIGLAMGIRHMARSQTWQDANPTAGQTFSFLLVSALFGLPLLTFAALTVVGLLVLGHVINTLTSYKRSK